MKQTDKNQLLTILVPAYNEEDNIDQVYEALNKIFMQYESSDLDFEIIFLDNCSTDNTSNKIQKICSQDERYKAIRYSRTFELDMSLYAGYKYASGDAIIVLYSDMQDPPEVIPEFIEKWREGYDVVYGVRTVRTGDPKWRNFLVSIAYKIINRLSDFPIPENTGDYRLITRRVRDALMKCTESNRYTRGLISWLGFSQVGVEYERKPRLSGESKVNIFHLFAFTLSAISSFSLKPLRIFTYLGFSILGLCFILGPFYFAGYLFGVTPRGITTVIFLLLLLIGFQSLGIGILGEYLGRTYMEVKQRPLIVIDEFTNFQSTNEDE